MKVIITGTTQGLGAKLAKVFEGEELLVINRRKSEAQAQVICDLSSKSQIEAAADEVLKWGREEVLFILNAGVYGEDETISDVEPEALGKILYANVFGQLTLVEKLIETGSEVRLVAISSQMASISGIREPYHYAYSVSKVGLNLSVRLLGKQYGEKLKYVLVNPGWMATQMGGNGAPDDPAEVAEKIRAFVDADKGWNKADGMLNILDGTTFGW